MIPALLVLRERTKQLRRPSLDGLGRAFDPWVDCGFGPKSFWPAVWDSTF